MTEYQHVQAAFINAIREEGTKQEACDYLQKQRNDAPGHRGAGLAGTDEQREVWIDV